MGKSRGASPVPFNRFAISSQYGAMKSVLLTMMLIALVLSSACSNSSSTTTDSSDRSALTTSTDESASSQTSESTRDTTLTSPAVPGNEMGLDELERTNPSLASSISSLSWVADGIGPDEEKAVELILVAATQNVPMFLALADKQWVKDGLSDADLHILESLNRFQSEPIAARIVDMDFLERVEPADATTLDLLTDLRVTAPSLLEALVEVRWVSDGLNENETKLVDWLRDAMDENVSLSIVSLQWVRDGVEGPELRAIEEFLDYEYQGTDVLASIVAMDWVQDDMGMLEAEAIGNLTGFDDEEVAALLVSQEWLQDLLEIHEARVIQDVSLVAELNSQVATALIGLPWIADGIDRGEAQRVLEMRRLAEQNPSLLALLWVQEGTIGIEAEATVTALVGLNWVEDGLDRNEARAVTELSAIASRDPVSAGRIIEMPFLESIEPSDVSALQSLASIAWSDEPYLARVLSHPTFQHGITDSWTDVVGTLHAVYGVDPELVQELLDPGIVQLEERTIDLPLGGETRMVIVRHSGGAKRSMDLLEDAVRRLEALMSVPFPDDHVRWLFVDHPEQVLGLYHGTHVSSVAEPDSDEDSYEQALLGSLAGHELSHYYWHGNRAWIDEGVSNVLRMLGDYSRNGSPIEPVNAPCPYVRTLADLEDIPASEGEDTFVCNYSLGERFFLDLYRHLGQQDFLQGLRDLYLMSQAENEHATGQRISLGVEDVRTAFKEHQETESSAVDDAVGRWYDGTEPYDSSAQDSSPPKPNLLSVDGSVASHLAIESGGKPISRVSADDVDGWLWVMLRLDYDVDSVTEMRLEVVNYYEDGFEFGRSFLNYTAVPWSNGFTWWFQAGLGPHAPWAEGRYQIRIYNEGQKLVEMEYEVAP